MSAPPFDLDSAWQIAAQVSVRPEPFGALLYHFGTRKLSFLKNTTIVGIVGGLAAHPSARAACAAQGVEDHELDVYARALSTLAAAGTITPRETT